MSGLKIAGSTLNQIPLDWENNLSNIRNAIQEAKESKVDILCLPELCITGYGCEDVFLSEWLHEVAMEKLMALRGDCHDITVAIGLPVRKGGSNYNCTAIISNGEMLGFSAKQHLANDGVYYEPRWFRPWRSGVVETLEYQGQTYNFGDIIYNVHDIKIGMEICEDAWVNDRPACRLVDHNVDLILNPSGSHFAFGKSQERRDLVIDSSKQFNCAYLYVNHLGNEAGQIIYDGEVLIARHGVFLAKNDTFTFDQHKLVVTDIDFSTSPESSEGIPNSGDTENVEFIKAQSLGLFDYMRKSRSKGFVLSLSGGADSSTCAVLVAEMISRAIDALGAKEFVAKAGLSSLWEDDHPELDKAAITGELLTCVYQASENSSAETLESASQLAQSLGARFHHWRIDDEVSSYSEKIEKAIGRKLAWTEDDITLQNIQARSRSPIIWMLTNIKGALLITTSNRSEGAVGYATMDGDTSGGLAPIGGVSKHFISNWLKWAEKELGYEALHLVNSMQPTAELRPIEERQTDESDLMPYRLLSRIEDLAIKEGLSPVRVWEKLKSEGDDNSSQLAAAVVRFFRLWSISQWKRERTAPIFHIDSFNISPRSWFRHPILSSGYREEIEKLEELSTR